MELLLPLSIAPNADEPTRRAELNQYFTPPWVCEAIVERHFGHLTMADRVLEPACGDGRFLAALPDYVDAVGVEIDPAMAEKARASSGRTVIAGDFLTAQVDGRFSHVIGNPPFEANVVHGFLHRIHSMLEDGGLCGLLLPAYIFQTSSKVMSLNRQWSISQELMPRNVFPGLKLPLVFAKFRKDAARTLVGFFLYRETADVAQLPRDVRKALETPARGSVWRQAVRTAFRKLGATTASLEALYRAVECPRENQFWRQQVRKVLQVYPEFRRVSNGTWALSPAV